MEPYSFFKQATKVVITVAFGVAAMAAFYQAYSNMFAEQQGQRSTPGF